MKIKRPPGRDWDVTAAHAICVCPPASVQVPGTLSATHTALCTWTWSFRFCLVLVCATPYTTSYKFHLQLRGLGRSQSLVIYLIPNHRPVGKPLPALPYFQLYLIDPIYPISSLLSCLSTFLTFFKSINFCCKFIMCQFSLSL